MPVADADANRDTNSYGYLYTNTNGRSQRDANGIAYSDSYGRNPDADAHVRTGRTDNNTLRLE